MQQCLGPCGREVETTNTSGLCARCQQAKAREQPAAGGTFRHLADGSGGSSAVGATKVKRRYKRREAAAEPNERPDEVKMCRRAGGCGKPRHRGQCAKSANGAATPEKPARRTRVARVKVGDGLELFAKLRQQYVDELAVAEKLVEGCRNRLETVNDILNRVQKGV